MKASIGKVKQVLDDAFLIEFEVPGLIDAGKAIPIHTMQQPVEGDEITVWGGDGVLNNLFVYVINQLDKPIIYKAFGNYIQNVQDAGMQMVSEEGDALVDGGNCAMVRGKSGAGLESDGPIHIKGGGVKIEKILKDIWTVLNSTATMYQAGGMPVTLVSPGKLPDIASDTQTMFADVDVPIMSDGGGSGSAGSGSSPGNAQPKTFSKNTKDCLSDIKDILDILKTVTQNLQTFATQCSTAFSTIVTPMGPGVSAGGVAASTTLAGQLAAAIAQLTAKITLLQTDTNLASNPT